MSNDFPESLFTLWSTFNKSKDVIDKKTGEVKREAKEGEYWAKAEWPIEQIAALHEWAVTKAEQVENQKGEACVIVSQKLMPRTSKAGNDYLLGVTSDPQEPRNNNAAPSAPKPAQTQSDDIPF